jgi:DNA-binding beta-propeller fold protein YncE
VSATRRDLLGGALASAAAPLLLGAGSAQAAAVEPVRQRVVRRGRALAVSADGRHVIVAHDMRTTIAIAARGRKRLADVGAQPVAVAVSADGARAAVATAGWNAQPGIALVDLRTGRVRARRSLGPAPHDLVFAGERLVVVGGEQEGTLHVLDADTLKIDRRVAIGRVPRGLAVAAGRAWVTLQADDSIVAVDLRKGRVARELRTPALPDRLAASPGGDRLLLTHGGRDSARVTEIELDSGDVRRHAAGRQPSAVAWTARGKRLVALGGEAAVVELGRGRRRRVAPAPRDLVVAGRRFWTVSALSGATSGGRL